MQQRGERLVHTIDLETLHDIAISGRRRLATLFPSLEQPSENLGDVRWRAHIGPQQRQVRRDQVAVLHHALEGAEAVGKLLQEGININITLMFSLNHYEAVADAYLRGLEKWAAKGEELSQVASVASFFVSRVDTLIDKELEKLGQRDLKGKIGIANAKMAYARYLTIFSSERWQQLERQGARPQRILYGSTSTKNPDYPDTLYIDNLMGANTVNTLPRKAIDALMDHGVIASGLTANLDEARRQINQLASLGLNLEVLTQHLQDEGVEKFAKDFSKLSDAIAKKREQFQRVPA